MEDNKPTWVAKIDNKKLLDIFDNISQFIDESNLDITKDGIGIKTADKPMVCFIDTLIPSSQFDTYVLAQEQKIGINLTNLVSVLKRGKSEKATLKLDKDYFTISFGSGREFTIPQLAMKSEELPDINSLKFQALAMVKGDVFRTAIEDCDIVSDTMNIIGNEDYLMFWTNGNTQRTITTIYKGDKDKLMELEMVKPQLKENEPPKQVQFESRYALEYLKKLKHLTDKVLLEFGTEIPLKISCNNGYKFSLLVAPRVAEN